MKKKIALLLSTLVVASTVALPHENIYANGEETSEANVRFGTGALEFRGTPVSMTFNDTLSLYGDNIVSDNLLSLSILDETGDEFGWDLKAKLDNFNSARGPVLEGAYITLSEATATIDESFMGTFSGAVAVDETLSQNTEVKLASAPNMEDPRETGMGPWNFGWTPTLNYLENTIYAADDNVTGNITWTLTANGAEEPVE